MNGRFWCNQIKKKNFQEANGVYVWAEVDDLSAELIRNFRSLRGTFNLFPSLVSCLRELILALIC